MKVLLWTSIVLGTVFGVLRYWFIDFHRVPEDVNDPRNWANAPNLEPGDLALVWRSGTPHAGDIVRCPDPQDPSRWIVARVIGLPGDKVEWNESGLKINGFRVRTMACDHDARPVMNTDGAEVKLGCQGEELGGSRHDTYQSTQVPFFAETIIETGKFFLVSDNRLSPWAYDSRYAEVGQVAIDTCTQRLMLRMWSKKGWGDGDRRLSFLF